MKLALAWLVLSTLLLVGTGMVDPWVLGAAAYGSALLSGVLLVWLLARDRRALPLGLAAALLSGCLVQPVPPDYKGPVAGIADSYQYHSTRKSDFFVLSRFDGKAVATAIGRTRELNAGRGVDMDPQSFERNVPARETRFTISASTEYAAPILAMTNPVYRIAGDMAFTPEAGGLYRVRGFLSPEYQAVWIENQETCQVMGALLESGERPADGIIYTDGKADGPHCRELVIGEVVRIERRSRGTAE